MKKTVLSLLLAGIFMISPMISHGAESEEASGKRFYFTSNGSAGNGWLEYKDERYYCDNGLMHRNGWFQTSADKYSLFSASGAWIKSASEIPTE